jgi:hypothetical protein
VANPTGAQDAVTLGYLQSNYSTSAAFSALSAEINAVNKQVASIQTAQARVMQTVSVSPATAGAATPAAASAAPATTPESAQTQAAVASANEYTDQQTKEALQSANAYAQSQSAQTLSAANAYTNTALNNYVTNDTFNQYQQQVTARFDETDKRINETSAMSTAMVEMAASAAGIDTTNRVGVGVGSTHGRSAIAVGYQRAVGKNATVTIGASASSNDSTVGAGVGFGW